MNHEGCRLIHFVTETLSKLCTTHFVCRFQSDNGYFLCHNLIIQKTASRSKRLIGQINFTEVAGYPKAKFVLGEIL